MNFKCVYYLCYRGLSFTYANEVFDVERTTVALVEDLLGLKVYTRQKVVQVIYEEEIIILTRVKTSIYPTTSRQVNTFPRTRIDHNTITFRSVRKGVYSV